MSMRGKAIPTENFWMLSSTSSASWIDLRVQKQRKKTSPAIHALKLITPNSKSKFPRKLIGDVDAHLGAFTLRVRSILTSCVIWIPRVQWIRNSALQKDRVLGEKSVLATMKARLVSS